VAIKFFYALHSGMLFYNITVVDIWRHAKHDLKYPPRNKVIENSSKRGK
jgi:hypothetical protein